MYTEEMCPDDAVYTMLQKSRKNVGTVGKSETSASIPHIIFTSILILEENKLNLINTSQKNTFMHKKCLCRNQESASQSVHVTIQP